MNELLELNWIARAALLFVISFSCWIAWAIFSPQIGIDDD